MNRFRALKSKNGVFIQERQQTIFGKRWCSLWHFRADCLADCQEIARLLNKCNDITGQ